MKTLLIFSLIASVGLGLSPEATSAQQIFHQEGSPPRLIELYTSEGCSSCPPADQYLANLVSSPDLWHSVVPLAFHVDYWDYIGWEDRFAQPAFKQRQYDYRRLGRLRSVYTPGWLVDGKEWRGFFRNQPLPEQKKAAGGTLTASLQTNQLRVQYQPVATYQALVAHVALMGFDLHSDITAGENQGRRLQHQFVVLDKQQKTQMNYEWRFTLPIPQDGARYALAIWVTRPDQIPLQVTGDWILSP